ncbi:DUF3570 domain-containing protein [Polaribacter sp.]|uniref:DUF3570 domain-containing protein n=1 Tax=Polaribacter sp. TaxID=1920175 RepID=UPI003F6CAF0F
MKYLSILISLFLVQTITAQKDSTNVYKKRVLETTEVDFIASYYVQNGDNASVTGGIGNEFLTDAASSIIISMPLNADDLLTIDAGISAYTSASSSNGNPFDSTGASGNRYDDDDEYDDKSRAKAANTIGSPWVASSGASKSDVWSTVNIDYSHTSDDRNFTWNANTSFASEYDYTSVGFGGGLLKQFNEKNTTFGINAKVYLDNWSPVYPTELKSYKLVNGNLKQGFFTGITILDQNGNASTNWKPLDGKFNVIQNKARNTYAVSVSFSQILSKNAQISIFLDVINQQGWLANPLQRVYFKDVANYYIGNASSISNYTFSNNKDVFQLADDIERLPHSRIKIPLGMRFNYYVNETFVVRTYYRYYFDNWGLQSHTASLEVPIKISDKFTLYPAYRFYTQTAANYFAPYDQHLSTEKYYTSDYDLSPFNSNQFSFGFSYTDIFAKTHLYKLGLKSLDLKYYRYDRNTTFGSNLVNVALKFVMD